MEDGIPTTIYSNVSMIFQLRLSEPETQDPKY